MSYWAELAWLGGAVAPGVLIETSAGTITTVRQGIPIPPNGAHILPGFTLPGLANSHSHAFHRALRGTGQLAPGARTPEAGPPSGDPAVTPAGSGAGSFWTWREVMYAVAERLTPQRYLALARAVYAEMALAGITCVGEFHYLHHDRAGTAYADPNAMGEALIEAAAQAGIRITLLDTCYLSAGFGKPPGSRQRRFSDGTAAAWAKRASALPTRPHARIGAAIHSVRAVPADQLTTVSRWASERDAPLHVHLSEQPAENDACLAAHGRSPTELLYEHGVLGPRTTAVHATHLTERDIALLGGSATAICLCPTTERDLADGIGPAAALDRAGSPLSLGSDSHAVIDMFEEARGMELNERLRTWARGHWSAHQLLFAASEQGHTCLGWPGAGRIAPGAPADLVTVALDTVRTVGPPPRLAAHTTVFAATSADVRTVIVDGRTIVEGGVHRLVPDVPGALAESIAALR